MFLEASISISLGTGSPNYRTISWLTDSWKGSPSAFAKAVLCLHGLGSGGPACGGGKAAFAVAGTSTRRAVKDACLGIFVIVLIEPTCF